MHGVPRRKSVFSSSFKPAQDPAPKPSNRPRDNLRRPARTEPEDIVLPKRVRETPKKLPVNMLDECTFGECRHRRHDIGEGAVVAHGGVHCTFDRWDAFMKFAELLMPCKRCRDNHAF
ncbi:unnamed protein product [Closterium sp. Yama58-4]|nr:unnamed protein product [Closterium sp. Yama58-4]